MPKQTVEDFLKDRGYHPGYGSKIHCPFHADKSPSAVLNEDGTVFCWSCNRLFFPKELENKFGVVLEYSRSKQPRKKRSAGSSRDMENPMFTM